MGRVLVLVTSDDDGKTWTPWRATRIHGSPAHLLGLRDGCIFLTVGTRWEGQRGCVGRVLEPEGSDLDTAPEFVISNASISADRGYPWSVELIDGRVLVAHWRHFEDDLRGTSRRRSWKRSSSPTHFVPQATRFIRSMILAARRAGCRARCGRRRMPSRPACRETRRPAGWGLHRTPAAPRPVLRPRRTRPGATQTRTAAYQRRDHRQRQPRLPGRSAAYQQPSGSLLRAASIRVTLAFGSLPAAISRSITATAFGGVF